MNFLVQSTGADILRAACLIAESRGIGLVMTVHDAILAEAPERMVRGVEAALCGAMVDAAILVLGPAGAMMRVDPEIIPSGSTPELDGRDMAKYLEVMRWLDEARGATPEPNPIDLPGSIFGTT